MSRPRIGNYTIIKTLGVGSFGKVKLGVHSQTGHNVALKMIGRENIKSDMVSRVKREIQYLQLLRHPHIIKLYEVIMTATDCIMVIEYAGGELFNYIVERGRMDENEGRRFFQQIISAVDYCHRHKIVHRDLKPENLLLDKYDNVKIADFGLSNFMSDGEFLKTSCGSPNYAAPEVINGHYYSGPEVDVWSCGIILYVMLCGKLPFDDDSIPQLFKKISSGLFTMPTYLSEEVQGLLKAMLRVKPLERITIAEIRQHPWFLRNLPDYLQPVAQEDIDTTAPLNEEFIAQLVRKLPESRDAIVAALRDPVSNPATNHIRVAYQLVADQNRIAFDLRHTATSQQLQNYTFGSSPPAWNATPPPAGRPRSGTGGSDALAVPGSGTRARSGSLSPDQGGRRPTIDAVMRGEDDPIDEEGGEEYGSPSQSSITVLSSSLPQQHMASQMLRAMRSQEPAVGGSPLHKVRRAENLLPTGSSGQFSPPPTDPGTTAPGPDGVSPIKPPPIAIPSRGGGPSLAPISIAPVTLNDTFAMSPQSAIHPFNQAGFAATPLIGNQRHALPTSYQAYQQATGNTLGTPIQSLGRRASVSVPIPSVPPNRTYPRAEAKADPAVPPASAAAKTAARRPPRWHFGIRSRNPPREIMDEIYKTLRSLGIQWKPFNAWHVRCRFVYPARSSEGKEGAIEMAGPGLATSPRRSTYLEGLVVKFDMQLYKIDSQNYLVDFRYVPAMSQAQAFLHGAVPEAAIVRTPSPTDPAAESTSPPASLFGSSVPSQLLQENISHGPAIHSIFPFFYVCARLITKLAA
ncbi:Protein kinase [Tieghemiomyces parasiticus]|uniref:non-specific serine/threonine protein kinase n=1 Tax=Tieghemiomyces parasiticus TaxID=78921 RepID=A0A9W7ZYF5_9FUNG|nr:Protein kinase [Tieghemiomyces parasiticus]